MLDFKVTFDLAPFRRQMDEAVKKQIPFATMQALNATAREAERELEQDLPQQFTLRSGWLLKGIRTRTATKNRLQAEVGSRDWFMKLQAKGGVKRAKKGRALALPVGVRPDASAAVPRSRWPGRLKNKKGYALGQTAEGTGGLFKVTRKERKLWWVFVERIGVKRRWPLHQTVEEVVRRRWPANAAAALKKALKTRR